MINTIAKIGRKISIIVPTGLLNCKMKFLYINNANWLDTLVQRWEQIFLNETAFLLAVSMILLLKYRKPWTLYLSSAYLRCHDGDSCQDISKTLFFFFLFFLF